MLSAEVTIDERFCKGCGYCVISCPRGCLETKGDKFTALGYLLPSFTHPEQCNTCAYCAQMCPECAIEVYLNLE